MICKEERLGEWFCGLRLHAYVFQDGSLEKVKLLQALPNIIYTTTGVVYSANSY